MDTPDCCYCAGLCELNPHRDTASCLRTPGSACRVRSCRQTAHLRLKRMVSIRQHCRLRLDRALTPRLRGLLAKALRCTGGDEARGNQVLLGEKIAWRNLFWSLSNEMANDPDPWVGDAVLPNLRAGSAYRVFAPDAYPQRTKSRGATRQCFPVSAMNMALPPRPTWRQRPGTPCGSSIRS